MWLSHFHHVRLFAAMWTVACQAPCPWDSPCNNTGEGLPCLLQGIFPPRDQTCISYISCISRRVLYHERHLGSPYSLRPGFSSHSQPFPEKDLGLSPTQQRLLINSDHPNSEGRESSCHCYYFSVFYRLISCLDERTFSLIPPLRFMVCKYSSPFPPSGNTNEGNYELKLYGLVLLECCSSVCTCSVVSDSFWLYRLSPPWGLNVHGNFQGRILQGVAISYSTCTHTHTHTHTQTSSLSTSIIYPHGLPSMGTQSL